MFLRTVILFFIFFLQSAWAVDSRNRVEELFIWKVSDELKLSVPQERSFAQMIRNLNERRALVNSNLQDVIVQLSESKTTKEREKLLLEQKRLLRSYNEIALEEADKIQKIFGIDRAAQYYVLKQELTNRLKTALLAPEKSSGSSTEPVPKLGPPQVIEEK